jgi:RimJ/RimL family protein N-acetyltransferase
MEYIGTFHRSCHTTVLDSNERSIKLLKKLGYKKVCKAREGESRYEVSLWN